ncbi:MAG TPA: hypothetical protein VMH26_14155 [Burkholderiales bacterium]|nr:hypothetical protein [Burkholderiales bacterium]
MSKLIPFPDGGYGFLRGGFPYCQGVRALQGFAIERVRFASPLPMKEGFAAIEAHLTSLGRPRTALCAAELRSSKPFTMSGFVGFNEGYVAVLKQWGLFRDALNPVARSNVAPEILPPHGPSFYAFCYTVPSQIRSPNFVVAGSGEWPGGGKFPEDIVARGDVSPAGLQAKARWVLEAMERRLDELGASWGDVTAAQVYTVHDLHAILRDQIVPRAGNGGGLTWHYCRPPIEELEFEMDVRGVAVERVI